MTNICQYLSMYFSVSEVWTWMVVKFFKMASAKAVCILFQALTAPKVIELFPHKLVWNKGLNNLTVERAAAL